jgi:cyclopropane-fatty-acyl-phospholipid synthase
VYTIREWYDRYRAHKAEIVAMYDERFYRLWQFYLAVSLTMFRDAPMGVYQIQYLKRRDATPLMRDYMGAEETRLRAIA